MGESEEEFKRRKAESRLSKEEARHEELRKKVRALPEGAILGMSESQEKILNDFTKILNSHPRNKRITLLCETSWNPDRKRSPLLEPLAYLYFRYVVGDPNLPILGGFRNLTNEDGLLTETTYLGKPFQSQDQDLREKLEKKGALISKPYLLCVCGREVRFSSYNDFLECVKVILSLGLKEAPLSLFQEIKDRKGKTRS